MSHRFIPVFAAVAVVLACSPAAVAQSRGELLYTTHCIACHTTQGTGATVGQRPTGQASPFKSGAGKEPHPWGGPRATSWTCVAT